MRLFITTIAAVAILGGTALAQEASEGGRSVFKPKGAMETEPSATTGAAPVDPAMRARPINPSDPNGARGGRVPNVPNPDRGQENTPGGQAQPN
jgi:hypothetical protein